MTNSEKLIIDLLGKEPINDNDNHIYKAVKEKMIVFAGMRNAKACLDFCIASGCRCEDSEKCQKYQIFKRLTTE